MPHRLTRILFWPAIALAVSACSLFPDLGLDTPPPSNPIFSDVERIELQLPGSGAGANAGTNFQFDAPSEVRYLVLAVFTAPIQVQGSRIVNEPAWAYGSRSGLSGFSRSSVQAGMFYQYDPLQKDYNTVQAAPVGGVYYWAVWGYDKWGNLTHASPQWQVSF
jgi:hypothetical protein